MVNVGAVAIHPHVERIFSFSNILDPTLLALNCIDNVPGLAVSSAFNFNGSTPCLAGKCVNSSNMLLLKMMCCIAHT